LRAAVANSGFDDDSDYHGCCGGAADNHPSAFGQTAARLFDIRHISVGYRLGRPGLQVGHGKPILAGITDIPFHFTLIVQLDLYSGRSAHSQLKYAGACLLGRLQLPDSLGLQWQTRCEGQKDSENGYRQDFLEQD
jgi:hypothetical protein